MSAEPTPESTSIVVLNWNSSDDTVALVDSLPAPWRDRVLVVDNGSSDVEALSERLARHAAVSVVRRPTNGGYAAGMNTGMRTAAARGDRWALLLNADCRPSASSLAAMVRAAGHRFDIVGIAQTKGLATNHAGNRYPTAAVGRGLTPKPWNCPGCPAGHHEVNVVTGAALLVSLSLAERLGGFDEGFFHFKEEFDLSHRARLLGARIGWVCEAEVPHAVGGSLPRDTDEAAYYTVRNELLFFRKHLGARAVVSGRLAGVGLALLVQAWRAGTVFGALDGLRDGVRGRTGPRVRA